MKVIDLEGAALDWAVAKCLGLDQYFDPEEGYALEDDEGCAYEPSCNWAQGGPFIERERINVYYDGGGHWCATTDAGDPLKFGTTPLIAAMRCYVASKLGDEIEVPDELMEGEQA